MSSARMFASCGPLPSTLNKPSSNTRPSAPVQFWRPSSCTLTIATGICFLRWGFLRAHACRVQSPPLRLSCTSSCECLGCKTFTIGPGSHGSVVQPAATLAADPAPPSCKATPRSCAVTSVFARRYRPQNQCDPAWTASPGPQHGFGRCQLGWGGFVAGRALRCLQPVHRVVNLPKEVSDARRRFKLAARASHSGLHTFDRQCSIA